MSNQHDQEDTSNPWVAGATEDGDLASGIPPQAPLYFCRYDEDGDDEQENSGIHVFRERDLSSLNVDEDADGGSPSDTVVPSPEDNNDVIKTTASSQNVRSSRFTERLSLDSGSAPVSISSATSKTLVNQGTWIDSIFSGLRRLW
ncbi:hypothetical protein ABW19_dt0208789 [Dactylella cylindrospora]|nr:hypothetical protein ABW19_dt0208789 [Dactylella cylindrospora]